MFFLDYLSDLLLFEGSFHRIFLIDIVDWSWRDFFDNRLFSVSEIEIGFEVETGRDVDHAHG